MVIGPAVVVKPGESVGHTGASLVDGNGDPP